MHGMTKFGRRISQLGPNGESTGDSHLGIAQCSSMHPISDGLAFPQHLPCWLRVLSAV